MMHYRIINNVFKDNLCYQCLNQFLWAFEKGLAGKRMPAGTKLGTAALVVFVNSVKIILVFVLIIFTKGLS
jgi:hypothetical protein